MNATPANGKARNDMLCDEEERALSRLRDIVARIRGSGGLVNVSSVEEEIRSAGGSRVHSLEPDGPCTFLLGGARFTLRPSATIPGKIEVSFIPIFP